MDITTAINAIRIILSTQPRIYVSAIRDTMHQGMVHAHLVAFCASPAIMVHHAMLAILNSTEFIIMGNVNAPMDISPPMAGPCVLPSLTYCLLYCPRLAAFSVLPSVLSAVGSFASAGAPNKFMNQGNFATTQGKPKFKYM